MTDRIDLLAREFRDIRARYFPTLPRYKFEIVPKRSKPLAYCLSGLRLIKVTKVVEVGDYRQTVIHEVAHHWGTHRDRGPRKRLKQAYLNALDNSSNDPVAMNDTSLIEEVRWEYVTEGRKELHERIKQRQKCLAQERAELDAWLARDGDMETPDVLIDAYERYLRADFRWSTISILGKRYSIGWLLNQLRDCSQSFHGEMTYGDMAREALERLAHRGGMGEGELLDYDEK